MSAPPVLRRQLEDQRDFLLRSIEDLDAEHAAGDLDDADYRALRSHYTARAAAVLRQLADPSPSAAAERAPARPAPARPAPAQPAPARPTPARPTPARPTPARPVPAVPSRRRWSTRRRATVAAVAAALVAVVAYAAVASTGSRAPGGVATGAAVGVERQAQLLTAAASASAKGDNVRAIEDYEAVLKVDPNQVTALTDEGWILAQTQQPALLRQGIGLLGRAEHANPDFPPAHVYRGVAYLSEGDYPDAVPDLEWYLDHQPDPSLAPRVRAALAVAESKLASSASTATTAPAGG